MSSKLGIWWRQVQGNALFVYFRLVTLTSRWHFEGRENVAEARTSGRPILWTFWHGQTMPFMHYGDRFEENDNFTVIAVGDERFDVLGTLGTRLGAGAYAVDMSGNPVAAGRAVLRVIKAMKRGKQSIIAPDGPDGPPFVPKEGVSFLARKAAAAVLPVGIWTSQAYQLRRWDRYLVPFPFARFQMVVDRPILAEPEMESNALMQRITDALDRVRARAQLLAGVKPWR